MILLAVIVICCYVLWSAYFYLIGYRKRDMKGECVLITGGGGGLGRQMGILFAELGCSIILVDVNENGLKEAKTAVEKTGSSCTTFVCDVTDGEAVKRLARDAGRVDTLVLNAGVVGRPSLLSDGEIDEKQANFVFGVNVLSHFSAISAFLPQMRKNSKGHIVTISSASGLFGVRNLSLYAASKWAATGLAESLYLEARTEFPEILTTAILPFYMRDDCTPGIKAGLFEGAGKDCWISVLDMSYVAARAVEAVQRGEEKVVLPWLAGVAQIGKILPPPIGMWLMQKLGVLNSMDTFQGRPADGENKKNK